MDKIKFWGIVLGFIGFLWLMAPSYNDESDQPSLVPTGEVADKAAQADGGMTVSDSGAPQPAGGVEITAPEDMPEPMKFQTAKVPITTPRGNLPLMLGFAHTREQQQAGLMNYRVWPNYMHGLLFLFTEEDSYSMWMHDTYLPLDIAFIDRNGYIVDIVENTTPLSDSAIKAPVPVLAVLELPGGSTKKWNINKGDRLRLKYFRSGLPAQ